MLAKAQRQKAGQRSTCLRLWSGVPVKSLKVRPQAVQR